MRAVEAGRPSLRVRQECPMSEDIDCMPEREAPDSRHGMPCPYEKNATAGPIERCKNKHTAQDAALGRASHSPLVTRHCILNRNTPKLKPGLSRFSSAKRCLLIATLSTTRRRVAVPSDQRESRDLQLANRRSGEGSSSRENNVSEGPALRLTRLITIRKSLVTSHSPLPVLASLPPCLLPPILIYGTGIRNHRNSLKKMDKAVSKTRYRTSSGIMLTRALSGETLIQISPSEILKLKKQGGMGSA